MANYTPLARKKEDSQWRKELLQGPASSEPRTAAEVLLDLNGTSGQWTDVCKICIAFVSLPVVSIHGRYRLRDVLTTSLVDAAGIWAS